jgi:ElaB/YqjD/DUF883 family membrane-anchored ribosome-binding protein
MERNADDTFGATGNPGSTGGTGSMGSGSSVGSTGMSGTGASSSGLDYSASGSQTNMGSDPATTAEKAKDAVQDKFGQIKDKARNLQSTLADRLDQGADKIRQRNASSTLAGATGDGGSVAAADNQAKMQDSVARGMQKSADWLRNGDLKADVERQVRENPGRTLLVALGVGYLLGKAFRGPNR